MNLDDRQNRRAHPPKQIVYVWNYLEWGGVQTYFLSLMRGAAEKYRVRAVMPNGSGEKILRYLEAAAVEYDFYEGRIDLSEAASVKRKIKRRLNDFRANCSLAKHLSRYDLKNSVVQIDVAPWTGFALLYYLVWKTNVFVTLHTAIEKTSLLRKVGWQIKLWILSRFKNFHLHASNLDVKKSLRPFVGAARYEQIAVIHSSFSRKELEAALRDAPTKTEIAAKYGFPSDKIWLCNVGQFIERKGNWTLLEALQTLRRERRDLFCCWLGTAPLDGQTREKIAGYNLEEDFKFLTSNEIGAHRRDLLTLWQSADVFVLPSLQEGLPMALIEAMALGKACVATNINAIPEAVAHLETGVLINAGDPKELAAAIGVLADDAELRMNLGENARKTVFEKFEENITGRKMLRLYDAAFGGFDASK